MKAQPTNTETSALVDQFERSFRGGAWHGPSLTEVVDGVDAARARANPQGFGHTVFQLLGHVAYWMEVSSRRLTGAEEYPSWPDWSGDDDGTEEAWAAARERLESSYRKLSVFLNQLEDHQLDEVVSNAESTVRGTLMGVLQHNAYHAGQIRLILRSTEGSS